jgi:hypothetical protein
MEPAETAITRERVCKRQMTAGYHGDRGSAPTEELWKGVFSVHSVDSSDLA